MKFSDNIVRHNMTTVYVKRTKPEMEEREEYNSRLWEQVKYAGPSTRTAKRSVYIYKTPARDVKYGESIYDANGNYIAYRVN